MESKALMRMPLAVAIQLLIAMSIGISSGLAQEPVFELTEETGIPGDIQPVRALITSDEPVQAWSFSVCHDSAVVTPLAATLLIDHDVLFFSSLEVLEDGVVTIVLYNPLFDAGSGVAAFAVPVTIEELADGPGFPNTTHGFFMCIAHDASYLEATGAAAGVILFGLNGGDGAALFSVVLLSGGVTRGVVCSITDFTESLEFVDAEEAAVLEYTTVPDSLMST